MNTIQISLYTDHEQRLYIKSQGITLTQAKQDEIISELRDNVQKTLYENEGSYQFNTILPEGVNRLKFKYYKKENPEYRRSPIIIFEASKKTTQDELNNSLFNDKSLFDYKDDCREGEFKGDIHSLQDIINKDIEAGDRDAYYLNKVLKDYYEKDKEKIANLDPQIMAFILDIIKRINVEEPLYKSEYLIALRKLTSLFSDFSPISEFLEQYYGKSPFIQETNLFEKSKLFIKSSTSLFRK